ncbi:L-aspartate 1-decarboxylase [Candidatus Thermokryptus mobilis]|uniref:Aspartate 1-decarboxylase n=2 Tax=Candidatus Thermokryptus mobilis TaxID=1643428 RepID=A0A0S4MYF3_9BACT|nr:L-aspartate 1-decarboxylase [Candidatus Thermokryptus mobilis]
MVIYREMCKSKIHGAIVTQAELYYEGSITIDEFLLESADILPFEKVQVVNLNNGARFETYAIPGERNSGVICLNGPAARLGAVGDQIIIISYAQYPNEVAQNHKPKVVILDKDNKIKQIIYGTINEIAK